VETVEPLSIGTPLRLRLSAAGVTVDVMGTVVWSQIDDLSLNDRSDRYLSGLTFAEEAPRAVGELIQKLLEADVAVAIEDCRNADRYRLSTPLTGSFGSRHTSVVDISINGARLAVRQFLRHRRIGCGWPSTVSACGEKRESICTPCGANLTVCGPRPGPSTPSHREFRHTSYEMPFTVFRRPAAIRLTSFSYIASRV
jgi:hypothetical protein